MYKKAFTLLEVFMVVSLIGALAVLFILPIFGSGSRLGNIKSSELIARVVQAARTYALNDGVGIGLGFDSEKQIFILKDAFGNFVQSFPMDEGYESSHEVYFHRIAPELELNGAPVYASEEREIDSIFFSAIGVSAPFRVSVQSENGEKSFRIHGLSGQVVVEDLYHF
jgi:Tfp pilus assembly protein FimT